MTLKLNCLKNFAKMTLSFFEFCGGKNTKINVDFRKSREKDELDVFDEEVTEP